MSQRTQISRTECPKQTLQSPVTFSRGVSFFLGWLQQFPNPRHLPHPYWKALSLPQGNSTGSETSTGAFKLHPENCTVKQKPAQASSSAGDAAQTTEVKTAKKASSATHPHSWVSHNSLRFAPIHLFPHISLVSQKWLSNSNFICITHYAENILSKHFFLLLFWTGGVDSSRTAPAHEFIPSLLIHLQVKLLLMSPASQEILWSQF